MCMSENGSKHKPSAEDIEAALIEVHGEKIRARFNGVVQLHYHEGNLKKIKEEVTIRDLSK